MAHSGSEYVVGRTAQRETRFGFVKALANKRSETIKDAMVVMQKLLPKGENLWAQLTTG